MPDNQDHPDELVDGQEPDEQEIEQAPNVWDAVQHPEIAAGVAKVLESLSHAIEEWTKNEPQRVKVQVKFALLSHLYRLANFRWNRVSRLAGYFEP